MKKLAYIFALSVMAALIAACSIGAPRIGNIKNTATASSYAPVPTAQAAAPMEMEMRTEIANDSAVMGGGGLMDYGSAPSGAPDVPREAGGGVAGPTVRPVVDSRKIIKEVRLELQTLKFDEGVDVILKLAEDFGGYIQDSYVQGRDMYNERGTRIASFTARVPSERLDAFVNSLGGGFNLISKNQNSQDVTETYFDSKARLDALKIQEGRLLDMLEGAKELEYMLQLEDKLMNVRYEIESLTSSLSRLEGYVSMSTVNISLYEVVKYEPVEDVPVTFSSRISRAFSDSIKSFTEFSKDAVVAVVFMSPLLVFLAVVAFIILKMRSRRKKIKAAKSAQVAKDAPAKDDKGDNE